MMVYDPEVCDALKLRMPMDADWFTDMPTGARYVSDERECFFLINFFGHIELATLEQFCLVRGVSKQKFRQWCRDHEEYQNAWEVAETFKTGMNSTVFSNAIMGIPGFAAYDTNALNNFLKATDDEFNPTSKVKADIDQHLTVDMGETFAALMMQTSALASGLEYVPRELPSVRQALREQAEINYRKQYSREARIEKVLAFIGIKPHEVPINALPAYGEEEFTAAELAWLEEKGVKSGIASMSAADLAVLGFEEGGQ